MNLIRYFFPVLLFAAAFTCTYARDMAWPPSSKDVVDTMNMRMTIIGGLPDSVAARNPLIFVNKIDDDEHDLYVLNKYLRNVYVRATMISPNPDIRGRAKAYAKITLLNFEGEEVKTLTTNQSGSVNFNIGDMGIPDGFYRIRVDYGGKYTKSGTKPKSRLELHVSPRVSLPKADPNAALRPSGPAVPLPR